MGCAKAAHCPHWQRVWLRWSTENSSKTSLKGLQWGKIVKTSLCCCTQTTLLLIDDNLEMARDLRTIVFWFGIVSDLQLNAGTYYLFLNQPICTKALYYGIVKLFHCIVLIWVPHWAHILRAKQAGKIYWRDLEEDLAYISVSISRRVAGCFR